MPGYNPVTLRSETSCYDDGTYDIAYQNAGLLDVGELVKTFAGR